MLRLSSVPEVRKLLVPMRMTGMTIGFVPTMGALHNGHLSLVNQAVKHNDFTVVSIFVNPAQFGPNEDFGRYPRSPDEDLQLLQESGADAVFMPEVSEIYAAESPKIHFQLPEIGTILCGATRPGHFEGVLMVVSRLFNIISPQKAYFGQKDYQQLQIITQFTKETFSEVEIVPCAIVRENDGLAMSSRNRYLLPEERLQATGIHQTLQAVKSKWLETNSIEDAIREGNGVLNNFRLLKKEYLEIMSADLRPVSSTRERANPIALIAVTIGKTRLIDNMFLEKQPGD